MHKIYRFEHWQVKFWRIEVQFAKFANVFHRQRFALYGICIIVATIDYAPAKKDGIVERSEAPNMTPSRFAVIAVKAVVSKGMDIFVV